MPAVGWLKGDLGEADAVYKVFSLSQSGPWAPLFLKEVRRAVLRALGRGIFTLFTDLVFVCLPCVFIHHLGTQTPHRQVHVILLNW